MPEAIHSFDKSSRKKTPLNSLLMIVVIAALLFGIGTGFAVSKITAGTTSVSNQDTKTADGDKKAVGIVDKSTFKDSAEGILKEGGIEGEGSFHLERPGGASQHVYLTSSTVDLSEFIGKKIRVWGQTFEAEKAGWLMDVGYVESL